MKEMTLRITNVSFGAVIDDGTLSADIKATGDLEVTVDADSLDAVVAMLEEEVAK